MNFNIFNQSKKVAVLIGATGGLGKHLIQHLLERNYDVVIVARNLVQLEQISLQFGKAVTSCACDITRTSDIQYLCNTIQKQFGHIDALIHSAGNIHPGLFSEQSDATIVDQIQVNLTGAAHVTKTLLPLMSKNSSIIFINSLGGLLPLKGSALYSASKCGLRGFALALAQELRPDRIYVSSIFPAAIETEMLHQEIKAGGSPLNFCSPPLSPDIVCRTIIKAIKQKRLEYYLPKLAGLQIKLLMLKPSFINLIMPHLERMGKKGQKIWQEKHRQK